MLIFKQSKNLQSGKYDIYFSIHVFAASNDMKKDVINVLFQPLGSVVPAFFSAHDPDGWRVYYKLDPSPHSQYFNLHPSDPHITVLKRLDRDEAMTPMVYRIREFI